MLEQAIQSNEGQKQYYEQLAALYRQDSQHEKANQILYKRRRLEN